MNKQELQKRYQEIVLKTNGGNDDYVVALCQIANAINELDEPKQDNNWQQAEIDTLKSEKENLERTLEESAEMIREKCTKWQKLKEWLEETIKKYEPTYDERMALNYDFYYKTNKQSLLKLILDKMSELDAEDEN